MISGVWFLCCCRSGIGVWAFFCFSRVLRSAVLDLKLWLKCVGVFMMQGFGVQGSWFWSLGLGWGLDSISG